MTSVPHAGLVGRCLVRSRSRNRAIRFGELGTGVLDRAPVGRGAYLVIRRIAVGAGSIRDRDEALADGVAEAARSAARPSRGHIPSDATAVLFIDHAEMAATLLLDIARGGATHHWWWTHLDARVPGRVAEAMLDHITAAPAAFDRLDSWGTGGEVLSAMSEAELASVADAMEQTHLHPSMREVPTAADAASQPGDIDATPRERPIRAPRTRPGSPQTERLARIRHVIATQRPLPTLVPDRSPSKVQASLHHASSPESEANESKGPVTISRVGAAPASAPESGDADRATKPGGTRPPTATSLEDVAARVEPPSPLSTDTARRAVGEHGPPVLPDPSSAGSRTVEIAAPQRPATAPTPREPTRPAEPAGFPTQLAGLFYLVGGLPAIDLPAPVPWGHERWALLAAIVHRLVEDTPDPIWSFLRDVAAHSDPAEPFPPPELAMLAAATRRSFTETFDLDDDELAELVATPGIVCATSTHIDVQIPLERISMAARMRGLDADPGWCPELGYVIRFHFEDV